MRLHNLITEKFLNETDSYPYTSPVKLEALSVINNSPSTELLITIGTFPPLTIPVPANSTYDGEFGYFYTVNVSGSTNFDIELKRS